MGAAKWIGVLMVVFGVIMLGVPAIVSDQPFFESYFDFLFSFNIYTIIIIIGVVLIVIGRTRRPRFPPY